MASKSIPIGTFFERLEVIGVADVHISANGSRRSSASLCRCRCGTVKPILNTKLLTYSTKSCGCLKADRTSERSTTHGATKGRSPISEYRIWQSMKDRCLRKKHGHYKNYGGRGIRICERWLNSFENFLADMGPRPSAKHTLDRFPDNSGNYEPSNCRWATRKDQSRNKRTNRIVHAYGVSITVAEWSEKNGVKAGTIHARLNTGRWTNEAAVSTPAAGKLRDEKVG